jgi:hypothetical protein
MPIGRVAVVPPQRSRNRKVKPAPLRYSPRPEGARASFHWGERDGARRPSIRIHQGNGLGDGVGTNVVGTGTLLLDRPVKEARGQGALGGNTPPSRTSESPSKVTGPVVSVIPSMPTFVAGADTNTPFLPITAVVKSVLMAVTGTSSQQLNSVEVDNWFSLPIALGLPPKKSRSTKVGKFGRLDSTSNVRKVRSPWVKVGPVVRLLYLTSPMTCPVTAW